jgi:hypothetical protein
MPEQTSKPPTIHLKQLYTLPHMGIIAFKLKPPRGRYSRLWYNMALILIN